ncbi:HXXEE domain-containing protein [Mycoplasmatota bacterium]|nr:HXXEE domain-containing protein [Mycoplasmatota bacterium]
MINIEFVSVIWLFPIVFMLHDFEEIIFMKWWIQRNRLVLLKKFSKISKVYNEFSTEAFALAVSEEFIILFLITLGSIIFNWYYLWLGVLIGFLFI